MSSSHSVSCAVVKLIWITPNADQIIGDLARVSSPNNQGKDPAPLIQYMMEHRHWSPFEMASACFEIETTRAIAHQILRHRSFSFQEFSQRYARAKFADTVKARIESPVNRQSSIQTTDADLIREWEFAQWRVIELAWKEYSAALKMGIAREVARAILPEGLTQTRLYMSGTIRSWLHYLDLRTAHDTQEEHRKIALDIAEILSQEIPITMRAYQLAEY